MVLDILQSLASSPPGLWWVLLLPIVFVAAGVGVILLLVRFAFLAGRHGVTPGRDGPGGLRSPELPGFDGQAADTSGWTGDGASSGSDSGFGGFW